MPLFKDSETRYNNAIQYLKRIDPGLANQVSAKSKPADGELISLGLGHGAMAGLSPDECEAMRALLLCHLALNPTHNIRGELPGIRRFFTTQKAHIKEAIESFTVTSRAGAAELEQVSRITFSQENPGVTTWRGNNKADLGTCWNYVASCAFQAGIISLQKCIGGFFKLGAVGATSAAKVLMNNATVNRTDYDRFTAGQIVGFYRCPATGPGGQLTHITIGTGTGSCIGARQPTNPTGIQKAKITACLDAFPKFKGEVIRVRVADPAGMENR